MRRVDALAASPYPIVSCLVGAGLALQAFGAVYKPEALGFLAASPGVPILLLAAVLSLPLAARDRVSLYTWILIVWGLFGSAVSAAYFGYDALYASKMSSLLILSIAWFSPLLCFQSLSLRTVRIGMAAGIAICLVGFLTSDVFPSLLPGALRGFVFGGEYSVYYDDRPRAFMAEPSHFGAIVGRYGILLYLLSEVGRPLNRIRLGGSMVVLAMALLITGSKGAAIAIAFTLVLMVVNRKAFGFALVLIPVAWWLVNTQLEALSLDLDKFTSTATRTGLWLAGAAAVVSNPFGWGYYGFYGTVSMFGNWAMDRLYGLPFIFTELEMIVGDLSSVSYKTTLLDFAVVFGWPFLFFMAWMIRQIDLADLRARCVLAFLVILAISTAGHESISFFLGFALLLRYFPSAKPEVLVNTNLPATASR